MQNQYVSSFESPLTVAVIGASGAIGKAFINHFIEIPAVERIYAFSRSGVSFAAPKVISGSLDLLEEGSIARAAASISSPLHITIVATGLLHGGDVQPEKSLKDISPENFGRIFALNATGPALVAKHFLPLLPRSGKSVFAALSARVGSISDNQLGGWYAYRASKAALNMLIKNTAIETARKYKDACIIGLHPGTVDSSLSKPFQAFVKDGHLFKADHATAQMLQVVNNCTASDSGKLFAYDGQEIPF